MEQLRESHREGHVLQRAEEVMVMRRKKAVVKTWKGAATWLLASIALQAGAPATGWSHEPAPAQAAEELTKQESIYRSQGTEIPAGYVTGRALSDYVAALPSG